MTLLRRIGLIAQSLFYVAGGINHFLHAESYRRIMPDHYAHPNALVSLSGVAEIAGGIGLLVPATRRRAAIGIMLMLVVFLDVHQFMLRDHERFPEIPLWVLWVRIPLQFALIAWAWSYAFPRNSDGQDHSLERSLVASESNPQQNNRDEK